MTGHIKAYCSNCLEFLGTVSYTGAAFQLVDEHWDVCAERDSNKPSMHFSNVMLVRSLNRS